MYRKNNIKALTGPGAESSHYSHSAGQKTGFSVFPVNKKKHTLKTGHHVLCTQHRYDLSAGGCSDYTTQTKHKRSFIKIWLHILWQAAAESSHPDNKGRLTKTLHKPSSLSMHSSTTGSSYHLNTHTHSLELPLSRVCVVTVVKISERREDLLENREQKQRKLMHTNHNSKESFKLHLYLLLSGKILQ